MKPSQYLKLYSLIGAILIAAAARILPHPPNVAPIAGLALFSGALINKKWGFVLPLGAMLISDLIIGLHPFIIWVYGSFYLIFLLGRYLQSFSFKNLALITLLSSTLFYVVTNFGVWAMFDMYPKTLSGLLDCYVQAIPFFRNTLIGDFIFSFGFFYGYKLISRIFTAVSPQKNTYVNND